jgi:hypothetical protein
MIGLDDKLADVMHKIISLRVVCNTSCHHCQFLLVALSRDRRWGLDNVPLPYFLWQKYQELTFCLVRHLQDEKRRIAFP